MYLDIRLLRLARQGRFAFGVTIVLGVIGTSLSVAQAGWLSQIIGAVFLDKRYGGYESRIMGILLAAIIIRAICVWGMDFSANHLAFIVKNDLRQRLFKHILDLGPIYTREEHNGEMTTVVMDGVEEVGAYYSQYLPQVVLAILAPLIILVFVFPIDWLSGLGLLLTAPLIPLFMSLIGSQAEVLTRRQWNMLRRLGAYFLDVIQGLVTLKLLGRSLDQIQIISEASQDYRRATMRVLRVTFLSALVLELVSTLSTAIIAVQIGLRLLYGWITFERAFFVLLLTPDFYLPLRMLGTRFHAGMSGATAAQRIFEIFSITPPTLLNKIRNSIGRIPQQLHRINRIEPITFSEVGFFSIDGVWIVQDISFTIMPGQKIALVGLSGAGKSCLTSLLLGFNHPMHGEIRLGETPLKDLSMDAWRQQIAWVGQNPYLFNTSVYENIRLGQPDASFEKIEQAAIRAHAHQFIIDLPQGYDTRIGEGGARLSAGQIQRIALARAFLKEAPLLILDESTSNLDIETEMLIQKSLSQLTAGRTVVVIAHRLSTIMDADQVIVLQEGRVVESGDPSELLRQEGIFHQMAMVDRGDGGGNPVKNHSTIAMEESPTLSMKKFVFSEAPLQVARSYDSKEGMRLSWGLLWKILFGWMRPYLGWVVLAILLGFATVSSSIGLLGASAYIISAAALKPSIAVLQVAIVGVRFFGLARGVFRYLERYTSHEVTFRILAEIRVWFYRALEPLAPGRLVGRHSADLLSRAIGEINILENYYLRAFAPPVIAALVATLSGCYLWTFDPRMGVTYIGFVSLATIVIPLGFMRLGRQAGRKLPPARSDLSVSLVDGLQGLADRLIYGGANRLIEEVGQSINNYGRIQKRLASMSALQLAASFFTAQVCLWALLLIAAPDVINQTIAGVNLGVILLIAVTSFEGFAPLPAAAQHLEVDLQAVNRLSELAMASPTTTEPKISTSFPHQLDISFKELSFAYPAEESELPLKNVLNRISFDLPQGKRLAVVGPSGSGKTTLIRLLLRFWDYQQGEIFLGDTPLREFSGEQVRQRVALAQQNPFIFSGTLRHNLLLANPKASQAELEAAIRIVRLDQLVQKLPHGFDTWIGERGQRLSGGERQRLSLARVLLQDASLWILDEPSANLDAITARQILEMILDDLKSKSLLFVTHQLFKMEEMDEILVLREGQIVERGNHAELIKVGGEYKRMWELQKELVE